MPLRVRASLVLATLVLVVPIPGAQAAVGPTDDQIEDAEDRVEELEGEIDSAEERLRESERELAALDDDLAAASEARATADDRAKDTLREAELARIEADRLEAEFVEARADLGRNRSQLDATVRDAWMHGGSATNPMLAAVEGLGSGGDPDEVADALHLLDVVIKGRGVAVEDTQQLLRRTEQLRTAAADATAEAERRAATAQAASDESAARHADVLGLVHRAETATREQQDLLASLESERSTASERVDDLEQAAETAAAEADAAVGARPVSEGLVSVGGITVASSLAPALEDLLEAARADGIVLSGFGYRSPETTARLRRANGCPDVYDSPASSCRVPTARPGQSMHEQGLAIDFTYQGRILCSCGDNAAFNWLSANAGRFGLQVLDTEAWHWSTNGE